MERESVKQFELDSLIGMSSLECVRAIIGHSPISQVQLRLYHYVPGSVGEEPIFTLPAKDFVSPGLFEDLDLHLEPGWNINLDSIVHTEGGALYHLPMMDLDVPKGDKALEFIQQRIQTDILSLTGDSIVLSTGKSYHLVGTRFLTEREHCIYLGHFLLAGMMVKVAEHLPRIHVPVADERYVGHTMVRGTSGLRLTTHGHKTFEPRVVAVLKP